jgi:hypothetical protein
MSEFETRHTYLYFIPLLLYNFLSFAQNTILSLLDIHKYICSIISITDIYAFIIFKLALSSILSFKS